MAIAVSFASRSATVFVCLLLWAGGQAAAQKSSEGTYPGGIALTVGATHAQFPFYADNAAGFDLAFFYQHNAFIGVQLKGSSYPYSSRFHQSPVTVGYRIGRPPFTRDLSLWTGWNPFAYIGGGVSYSQDSGPTLNVLPGAWQPAWQGSFGMDRQLKYFSWRVAEISWTETYTPYRHIGTVGVSTGVVFNFRRESYN